jgi:hypothetical protein
MWAARSGERGSDVQVSFILLCRSLNYNHAEYYCLVSVLVVISIASIQKNLIAVSISVPAGRRRMITTSTSLAHPPVTNTHFVL